MSVAPGGDPVVVLCDGCGRRREVSRAVALRNSPGGLAGDEAAEAGARSTIRKGNSWLAEGDEDYCLDCAQKPR